MLTTYTTLSQPTSCGPGGHRNDPTVDPVPGRPPEAIPSDNNSSPLDHPLDHHVKYTKYTVPPGSRPDNFPHPPELVLWLPSSEPGEARRELPVLYLRAGPSSPDQDAHKAPGPNWTTPASSRSHTSPSPPRRGRVPRPGRAPSWAPRMSPPAPRFPP